METKETLNGLSRHELNLKLDAKLILRELGLQLNKQNKIYSPYNTEKEPSCLINLKNNKYKNTYKDYSSGKELSDIIQLVMDVKGLNEEQAMDYCIDKMMRKSKSNIGNNYLIFGAQNINDIKLSKSEIKWYEFLLDKYPHIHHDDLKEKIISIILIKRNFYRAQIYSYIQRICLQDGFSKQILRYLYSKERCLTNLSINKFGVFEVHDPLHLKRSLISKFSSNLLEMAGIINKEGKLIFPRNSIVIPNIVDKRINYLSVRIMNNQGGRYRNLYNNYGDLSPKRLYNIDVLKENSINKKLFICEGMFDTIIATQFRFNAIGILGVNHIPLDDLKVIAKRYKIVLALDNDKAGNDATQKIINHLGKSVKVLKFKGCKDLTEVYSLSKKRIRMNPYMKIVEVAPSHSNFMESKKINTISAKEIMNLRTPKRNWIVPNFLYPGLALLSGRPKHGKSCLSFDLANAVAGRKTFLKKFTCPKGKVLYISYEEGIDDFKERITSSLKNNFVPKDIIFTCEWYQDENGNKIPHLTFPKLGEGGFELLEKLLKKDSDIKLVIIDPLGKTMSSNTRSTHDYKIEYEFLGKLQQLALKFKISVLVVHHDKKGDAKSRDQLILGTTAFAAAPDILMSLWKEGNDGILHINGRGVKETKYYLFMRNGSWESSNKKIELGLSPEQEEIYRHFKKCKGGLFQNKMIVRLVKKSSANVSKMLKALKRKKIIEEVSYGRYRLVV